MDGTTVSSPVVDAHVHVWDLDRRPQPWIDPRSMAVLARDFQPGELTAEVASAGVSSAVLVQVLNDAAESDDLMWAGAGRPFIGVVPWIDLLRPDLETQLDSLASHPSGAHLAGVRHQALAEPDPAAWLARAADGPAFGLLGRRGLAFDLLLGPGHLAAAYAAVAAHGGTTFVLDHAGKPPVTSGWHSPASQEWAAGIAALGRLPNAICKLSGLTTLADRSSWEVSDLKAYVDHVLACFGAERVMFGSDWPVSLRAGSYARTVETAHDLVATLSRDEQESVLAGTARRVYHLREPAGPTS
ncbi:L-fuconolactonase [Marmoricola sp. URHA0025 HA25]